LVEDKTEKKIEKKIIEDSKEIVKITSRGNA